MDVVLARTVGLLVVAMLVAIIARRSKLPYTVGLVITGGGFALLGIETGFVLTRTLIYQAILPPLLFEAAINIDWRSRSWEGRLLMAIPLSLSWLRFSEADDRFPLIQPFDRGPGLAT
jgi:CPA1 family monovalent cation:H+ antiporter